MWLMLLGRCFLMCAAESGQERCSTTSNSTRTCWPRCTNRRKSPAESRRRERPRQACMQAHRLWRGRGGTAAGAAATGLHAGTPVVAGAGDQAAGAVGMGIVEVGAVSATIGTSGVVFAATARPALDPLGRVHTFCHAVPGRWHVMGVTQAAGLSLRWFRDRFGACHSDDQIPYEKLIAEAATIPPGARGVLWAPYLMGERTPHLDPNARA